MYRGIVRVWRLEHINCHCEDAAPNHGPFLRKYPRRADHAKPLVKVPRPPFGMSNSAPARIGKVSKCGVTIAQMDKWWWKNDAWVPILWESWGWYFVVYEMYKKNVRYDSNQVIFNPQRALSRKVVAWKDVPPFGKVKLAR